MAREKGAEVFLASSEEWVLGELEGGSPRAGCEFREVGPDCWKGQLWLGGVRDWNSGYGRVSGHSGPEAGGSPCLDI